MHKKMNDFVQYVDVLIQAPIAVILIFHIHYTNKQHTNISNRLMDIIQEQTKILKQDKRYEAIKD